MGVADRSENVCFEVVLSWWVMGVTRMMNVGVWSVFVCVEACDVGFAISILEVVVMGEGKELCVVVRTGEVVW